MGDEKPQKISHSALRSVAPEYVGAAVVPGTCGRGRQSEFFMRGVKLVAAMAALSCVPSSFARAVDPKDMPWDEIDRVLRQSEPQAKQAEPATKIETKEQAEPAAAPAKTELPQQSPIGPARPTANTSNVPAAETAVAAPTVKSESKTKDVVAKTDPKVTAPLPSDPFNSTAAVTAVPNAAPPSVVAPVAATASPSEVAAKPKSADAAAAAPAIALRPSIGPQTPAKATSNQQAVLAPAPETSQSAKPETGEPAPSAANANALYLPIARYIAAKATDSLAKYDDANRQALLKFYTDTMGQPLWVTKDGYNDAAKSVLASLKDAGSWGMAADAYSLPDLSTGAHAALDDDVLTAAEVRLSLAAMQYALDARGGRIPSPESQLSSYLDRTPLSFDRETLIKTLSWSPNKGSYLESYQPKHQQFQKLREKLLALRRDGPSSAPAPIPEGPLLKPGKTHQHVALVRERLAVPAANNERGKPDPNFYDNALAEAVVKFKDKKGLSPVNANISNALRRALNQTEDVSEAKIIANMEEWRWMPESLGDLHVSVNIPEFMVRLVKNDKVIFEERIVSGKPQTQTPIFSNMMRTVVFQPRWNVPESIKMKELLPGLRAGGNPVARQGLVMMRNGRKVSPTSIDWSRADMRGYEVYQPPGGGNALGIVKFLFPNKHSVYLHDTPVKSLFNASVRTFSHGCMRVRNPLDFAEAVLKEDKGWDAAEIKKLATTGPEENEIKLEHPIPVHVTYFTATVGDDGNIQAFDDVYGHEKRITLALAGRWNEIEKNGEQTISPDDLPVASADGWSDQRDQIQRWQREREERWDPDAQPADAGPRRHRGNVFDDALRQVFGGV